MGFSGPVTLLLGVLENQIPNTMHPAKKPPIKKQKGTTTWALVGRAPDGSCSPAPSEKPRLGSF